MKTQGNRRNGSARTAVLALLTLGSALWIRPVLATHSLTISHTPPQEAKAAFDLGLEFEVSGDCEKGTVTHDESVTFRPEDASFRAELSTHVTKSCDPLEGALSYTNSEGESDEISPLAVSEQDEGGSQRFTFSIPSVHVTGGELRYHLDVWQIQHTQRTASGHDGIGESTIRIPHDESHTEAASYDGSLVVLDDESTNNKHGKGRGAKK